MSSNPGRFISLEGIDGAGKSTQARLLRDHLEAQGTDCVLTREPGGSTGAEEIRALLVQGETTRWSAETEILLFTAARRDHLERTIQPALDAGKTVISDRFADSTRVYQGAVRSDLRPTVDALHDLMIATEPDVTLIIDMDPDVSLRRGLARASKDERFESFGADFQQRLRTGFLKLAEEYPDRCTVIDGNRAQDAIAADIAATIDAIQHG